MSSTNWHTNISNTHLRSLELLNQTMFIYCLNFERSPVDGLNEFLLITIKYEINIHDTCNSVDIKFFNYWYLYLTSNLSNLVLVYQLYFQLGLGWVSIARNNSLGVKVGFCYKEF